MEKRWPFSIQGRLSRFYRINGCLKHRKNRIRNRQCRSKFLEAEVKQNTKTKTESYVLDLSNGISCGWKRKSTTGRFATGRFWPCTWKYSFVDKEKVNAWEFCKKSVTPIISLCDGSTHFFVLSFITDAIYIFFFGDRETSISILWKSRLFFSVKAYCVYIINKIIHGCLQSWSFSSRVQLDTKRL